MASRVRLLLTNTLRSNNTRSTAEVCGHLTRRTCSARAEEEETSDGWILGFSGQSNHVRGGIVWMWFVEVHHVVSEFFKRPNSVTETCSEMKELADFNTSYLFTGSGAGWRLEILSRPPTISTTNYSLSIIQTRVMCFWLPVVFGDATEHGFLCHPLPSCSSLSVTPWQRPRGLYLQQVPGRPGPRLNPPWQFIHIGLL